MRGGKGHNGGGERKERESGEKQCLASRSNYSGGLSMEQH